MDSLNDHLREHSRTAWDDTRHIEATVTAMRAAIDDGERAYQDWLAERHGIRQPLPDSLPEG